MVHTLTLNPSLDYVISLEQLVQGRVNRTITEEIFPGGKGINVSMVLKNLGHETNVLGFAAGFTGEELTKQLDRKGIPCNFIWVNNGISRINVKICENRAANNQNEETEINGNGPIITETEIQRLFQTMDTCCKSGDILVISGSAPKGLTPEIYAQIVEYCNRKEVQSVVDATGQLLWNTLPYRPFLIKPNIHELEEMFHCRIVQEQEIWFYAKKLQHEGAKNVLVSMGAKGAILLTESQKQYQLEAPKGMVINAVGAGDSMVAGFLAGYLENNMDYEKALKMAVCTGSASAFSKDLATREEVLQLCRLMDFKS